MEMDFAEKDNFSFPAYSALYHCIDDLIFTRGAFAHRITNILPDENDRNLKILNEKRLKEKLFREIMSQYNQRIIHYNLLLPKLSLDKKNILKIIKYKLVSDTFGDEGDYSGRHKVYPRTFVCQKCGDFRILDQTEWGTFNPNKCRDQKCNGKYEQVSILMFCNQCGKIINLYYPCKDHGTKDLKLIRREKDSLLTWRVVCRSCARQGGKEPIDIFRFTCSHKDENNVVICNEKPTKFKPLTIKEGGIYGPVVITLVDIPATENIELMDLEYILLGLHLDKFDEISRRIKSDVNLSKIESYFRAYRDQNIKNMLLSTDTEFSGLSSEAKDEKWKQKWSIDIIETVIRELKECYNNSDLENYNDYFAIKGAFLNQEKNKIISFDKHIDSISDNTRKNIIKSSYQRLKEDFGLSDIIYISDINLISSCIGLIHGVNKFYEQGFVPHFSPIWKGKKKEDLAVYSYPFETEGILIDLDKKRVSNWLIDNNFIQNEKPKNDKEAKELLLKIEKDTEAYSALKTLLHTLSHTLIKRSSIYTGLDSDSCSEMIFTNPASILIYSTSNINIGGFEYVFEHSLNNWFREVNLEIHDCTFDPTCIFETGACFSCLYLPEYVCSEFNHYLDRDVFIAKKRFKTSYW